MSKGDEHHCVRSRLPDKSYSPVDLGYLSTADLNISVTFLVRHCNLKSPNAEFTDVTPFDKVILFDSSARDGKNSSQQLRKPSEASAEGLQTKTPELQSEVPG